MQHTGSDQGRAAGEVIDLRAPGADIEETCRALCRLVVPTVADLAAIYMVAGDRLVRSGSASATSSLSAVADNVFGGLTVALDAPHPLADIVNKGEPLLLESITAEAIAPFFGDRVEVPAAFERLGLRSVLALPLVTHDRGLGLLALGLVGDDRRFGPDEQARAEDLAKAAAVVLENAVLTGELRSSVALLQSVLQTVPVGLAFFDRELRYVRVNDALATINGLPAEDHVGQSLGDILGDHVPDEVADQLVRVFATGESILDIEVSGTTPASPDELRHWVTSYFPVRSSRDGSVLFVGVVVVEITDRKRAESERLLLLQSAEAAHDELERAQSRLILLAEASRQFAGLNARRILANLVNLIVPAVADWAAVELVSDDGEPQPVTSAQSAEGRAVGDGPSIRVPLEVRGRVIGALTIAVPIGREGLPDLELRLARDLASRAALAVDTARLFEHEHRVALTLQHSLLPSELPIVPFVERAFRYVPGTTDQEVGGDWYDMVLGPDGRVACTVGDVVGHDIKAASVMGQLRNAVRVYAADGHEPASVALRLNRLFDSLELDQMATLVHLVMDPKTGGAIYTNAGHLPPLLIHADGATEWLEGGNTLPIGVVPEPGWAEETLTLAPGDTVLLFTDGLVEERARPLDAGLELLRLAAEEAATFDVETLCDYVVERLISGEARGDDVALMAVRWAAASAP